MSRSRAYYDEFSDTYERHRHRGYHRLLDDIEVSVAKRYAEGRLLEAGCGTGLILGRLQRSDAPSLGLDLSGGMLALARSRGLSVVQASVDAPPFPDESFDTIVSFKVLAHVPEIRRAVAELVRVTRPGGHLVLEFYNRRSLRYLVKRLKNPTRIGSSFTDEDVYTRYDSLVTIRRYLPPGVEVVSVSGARVVTPLALVHDVPLLGRLFSAVERRAAESPFLSRLAGFLIVVLRKV